MGAIRVNATCRAPTARAAAVKTAAGYLGLTAAGATGAGAAQTVAFDDINITATASGGFGINYDAAFGA